MRGAPAERIVDARARKAQRVVDAVHRARMPGDRDVDIVEATGAHHEGLGGTAFLGRTAVVAHAAFHASFGEVVLDCRCGEQRRGTEQIVSAGVPVAAALDLLRLRDACNLGQARQRIVFAKDRDHRPAIARLAHHGGRNARDVLGDAEAFLLQHGTMLGDRAEFAIAKLGHAPHAVRQRLVSVLAGVDQPPDFFGVLHVHFPLIYKACSRGTLRAAMRPSGPGSKRTDSSGPRWPRSISRSGSTTMTFVPMRIVITRSAASLRNASI